MINRLLVITGCFCLLSGDAYAYLDPGSGSLLFQSLLALFFTVAIGWRRLKQWIKSIFQKSPNKSDAADASDSDLPKQ